MTKPGSLKNLGLRLDCLNTQETALVGAPVFLENDANVAALGEAVYGAGKGYELALYVTIGSGIGGGLVIKNEIYLFILYFMLIFLILG